MTPDFKPLFTHGTSKCVTDKDGVETCTNRNVFDTNIDFYIGAKEIYNEYNFPGFYPTFEQCNFITGYHLTTST